MGKIGLYQISEKNATTRELLKMIWKLSVCQPQILTGSFMGPLIDT